MKNKKIVIIGGVAAGASAAAKARRCDEEAEIIMFEKGNDISYATCGLPYYLSGVISKRRNLLITSGSAFERRFKIQVRTNHEVTAINRAEKSVTYINHLSGETAEESYDKLILAPGSLPVLPPVPGVHLPFVFSLKTLEDTDKIYKILHERKIKTAVVVGGGLIGMETAENLLHLGIRVSMVEFMPQILPFLDKEMAEIVTHHARQKGLNIILSDKMVGIHEYDDGGEVELDSGEKIQADLVIIAVGIRPDTRLAIDAGLTLGETGAVKVSDTMQTSDPDIYAGGDCVESVNLVTGKAAIFPMGAAANKQGRAAGANVTGRNLKVKGFTGTVIVKAFDLAAGKTGLTEKEALEHGYEVLVTYILANHYAGYYPGAKQIRLKTVCEKKSGQILGAQVIGEEGVDKRIDVMATAIYNKMTVEALMDLDLAYAPPYSSARDPIFVSGAIGQNYYTGDYQPITPSELHEKINKDSDFILVDVRTKKELQKTGVIPGAMHIPIDSLRDNIATLPTGKEIVLYCAIGLRSYLGYRILKMKDYQKISSLTGGIGSWTFDLDSYKQL